VWYSYEGLVEESRIAAGQLIPATISGWNWVLLAISGLEKLVGSTMCVFQGAGQLQLSIEEFHVPFGGKLELPRK
jgi:hypothetical protein